MKVKPKKTERKAAKKADQKPDSKAKLARILGISRQLLNHHLKSGKAPPLDDVDAWCAMLASDGRDAAAPPALRTKLAEARHRLILAQARREELRLAQDERLLISKDEVRNGMMAGTSLMYGSLDRIFTSELPPILTGLDPVAIRNKCKSAIDGLKDELRQKFQAIADETNAAQPNSESQSDQQPKENTDEPSKQ